MVRVKEYDEPWIILDYAGCAGLAYFIHVEDDWPDVNTLGLLTPARNSSYQHPVIEGTLDENGYAKVSIPIELAAHPLNIVVYPPPDWSSVWFNISSGLQIIGGVSSIALACSATLLTGGAATVLSLGLAAWGADQLMTGVNNLVQQQPHKTLMAQGLEQLGASETYAETLTDVVGFANATALANLLVKNSAKLGLSTISLSLTERKQQVLLNYISLKTTKLNRKFSLRREQSSESFINTLVGEKNKFLEWNSWGNYKKEIINGKEYAKIGERLYSRHAVDRMQPSALGSPAGTISVGRNVSPNIVEHTIANGIKTNSTIDSIVRTVHWSGDVGVVTEYNSKIIVTILRRSQK